ncbi:MAG: flagellar motor switch protein FliG [Acidobacteriota bacterium]|nr:flagellar motor switch protein FliG [Acidobacteriota bacterium]
MVLAQLDTQRANRLLMSLSDTEVVNLMAAMATLPTLEVSQVEEIMADLAAQTAALLHVGQGGREIAARLLRQRFGDGRAEEVLYQFDEAKDSNPLAFLNRLEVPQLGRLIADEHPQTVAVILTQLRPDISAQVLAAMDNTVRVEIVHRIASMARVSPTVMQHLAQVLDQRAASWVIGGSTASGSEGGVKPAVAILNHTDRATEQQILGELEQRDPDLAERIRNEMFVFDDLLSLDDRSMQLIMRHVPLHELAVALKGADDDIRARFQANLSERAATDLLEELELLGPMRVSQVGAAQSAIAKMVRDLDAAGEITLSRGDDEFI